MSPKEGMYYVGYIGGIIIGVYFARMMGWHQIVGLICGIIVGIPCGILTEKIYLAFFDSKSKAAQSVIVECQNPSCGWRGDPGSSVNCPRCDQRLRD